MEESFRTDISLLVTECMVRAIEARTLGTKQTPEADRAKAVNQSMQEGLYSHPVLLRGLRAV